MDEFRRRPGQKIGLNERPAGSCRAGFPLFHRFLDRFAQPLHSEFEALRLEMAPALYLSLELLIGISLEIFPYRSSGGRALLREFLADEWVMGHCAIKASRAAVGNSQVRERKRPTPICR